MKLHRQTEYRMRGDAIPGEVLEARGRKYTMIDSTKRETAAGRLVDTFIMRGVCDTCGHPFQFQTGRKLVTYANCEACR